MSDRTEKSRDAIHATDGYKRQVAAMETLSDTLIDAHLRRLGLLAQGQHEDAIRAGLIELGWTPPWESMETALRDGSEFICWISASKYAEYDEGECEVDCSQWDFCAWNEAAGRFESERGTIGDSQSITHWLNVKPPRTTP